jgi:hypothetical protein
MQTSILSEMHDLRPWLTSLGIQIGETVQDCGFSMLEIGQVQDGLFRSAFRSGSAASSS